MKPIFPVHLLICLVGMFFALSPVAMAQNATDIIAALVNGEPVTSYEIVTDSQYQSAAALLQKEFQGGELTRRLKQLKLDTLERLIDQRLALQDFQRRGYSFPDSYIDSQVQRAIDLCWDGSETRLERNLASRGETLEDYRDGIRDESILRWETEENIDKKLKPNQPDEAQQREKLQAAWSASLRANASIERFW